LKKWDRAGRSAVGKEKKENVRGCWGSGKVAGPFWGKVLKTFEWGGGKAPPSSKNDKRWEGEKVSFENSKKKKTKRSIKKKGKKRGFVLAGYTAVFKKKQFSRGEKRGEELAVTGDHRFPYQQEKNNSFGAGGKGVKTSRTEKPSPKRYIHP